MSEIKIIVDLTIPMSQNPKLVKLIFTGCLLAAHGCTGSSYAFLTNPSQEP